VHLLQLLVVALLRRSTSDLVLDRLKAVRKLRIILVVQLDLVYKTLTVCDVKGIDSQMLSKLDRWHVDGQLLLVSVRCVNFLVDLSYSLAGVSHFQDPGPPAEVLNALLVPFVTFGLETLCNLELHLTHGAPTAQVDREWLLEDLAGCGVVGDSRDDVQLETAELQLYCELFLGWSRWCGHALLIQFDLSVTRAWRSRQ
jgi:hypothetical protein